jgi:hypothetical protein
MRDYFSETSEAAEKLHETSENLDFYTKSLTHFSSSFIEVNGNI